MKRFLIAAFCLVIVMGLASCNKTENKPLPPSNDGLSAEDIGDISTLVASMSVSDFEAADTGEYVMFSVSGYGSFVCALRSDIAPDTVKNFKSLVSSGFYNGLIFHRTIKDFMIEGGEQDRDGVIHDSEMINGEFASNGFENNLSHLRGVLSMSRTNIADSAKSKFFILCSDSVHLDGEYAAFGYVVAGMDVVDRIADSATNEGKRPTQDIIIESVTFAKKK